VAPVAERCRVTDVDRPEVTGPRIDVAEQLPMEQLEVSHVVPSLDPLPTQLMESSGDDVGFGPPQILAIRETEQVDQDTGLGVDVWIVAQCWCRATVRLTSSSSSISPLAAERASARNSGVGSRCSSRVDAMASSIESAALSAGAVGAVGRGAIHQGYRSDRGSGSLAEPMHGQSSGPCSVRPCPVGHGPGRHRVQVCGFGHEGIWQEGLGLEEWSERGPGDPCAVVEDAGARGMTAEYNP
jgi:hypothetical protein